MFAMIPGESFGTTECVSCITRGDSSLRWYLWDTSGDRE